MKICRATKKHLFFCLYFVAIITLNAQEKAIIGITNKGGQDNIGTIFKTDINGDNYTVLQDLKIKYQGSEPDNIKLCEYNGLLYGVTYNGGNNDAGVVFSYNPISEEYLKLHYFESVTTGDSPYSGLILANNGKMYGTTVNGGNNNFGVLYEFNPQTNSVTKLYDFSLNEGIVPYAPLIQANNGNLYGITNRGGITYNGVLFEFDLTTNTYTKKYEFDGTNHGQIPSALIEATNGNLYGLTNSGGLNNSGTLFSYDLTDSSLTKLFDFDGPNFGSHPYLGLIQASNGVLYGMTYFGGISNTGTIFKYNINTSTLTKILDLTNSTGSYPTGSLTQVSNNTLYGLTQNGGLNNKGTLFKIDISGGDVFTKILDFGATNLGETPKGTLALFNNKLYATTNKGGLANAGTLFEFNPDTQEHFKKIDFNYAENGYAFRAGFAKGLNDKLYITASAGGLFGYGTLLEFDPSDNVLIKKFDFSATEAPQSSTDASVLYASNNKIYGVSAYYGGQEVLFEFDLQTNTYNAKVTFDGVNTGGGPTELIEASNGNIYGMTGYGAANGKGCIFEYDFVNNSYQNIFNFDGTNTGGSPLSALFQATNGKLYGVLGSGGANNRGVLFEFDIFTNTFTKKFDFSNAIPSNAYASLIEFIEGLLYGMNYSGGVNSAGGIFEFNLNTNTYTNKFDFDLSTTGNTPQYRLLKTSENKLFGLNKASGANNQGVLFEFNPDTNIYTNKYDFYESSGGSPIGAPVEVSINSSLSISDNNNLQRMHIYPNPVSDKLVISSNNPEPFQIKIYNLLGKQVLLRDNVIANDKLKLAHLQSGIYILKVTTKKGNTQTIKFIKS